MGIWLQLLGLGLATMVFFFVPLQWYATRVEHRLAKPMTIGTRVLFIGVAYWVWYPPVAFVLISAWANEHFAADFSGLGCTLAVLWSIISHLYLEARTRMRHEVETRQ